MGKKLKTYKIKARLICEETVEVQAFSKEDALAQYQGDPTLRTRHDVVDVDEVRVERVTD